MKRSIKTLLVAATLAAGITAGLAYAMPPGHSEGCGHGNGMGFGRHGFDSEMRIDRMSETLGLTHEQRDKVRAIVDKARPATRELRDKVVDNHRQLRALMQQDNPKESEVRKLADAQGRLVADMIVQQAKVQSEIRAVLTPEQREKLQQRFGRRGPVSSFEPDNGPTSLSDPGASPGPQATMKQVAM
jgi:protein CpxP